jgi:hypothetical protein
MSRQWFDRPERSNTFEPKIVACELPSFAAERHSSAFAPTRWR